MYNVPNGTIFEEYAITDINGTWATVMLYMIEFKATCQCEEFDCPHRHVYTDEGPHPYFEKTGGVGTEYKARNVKQKIQGETRSMFIRIYFGKGRNRVALRLDDEEE